MFEFYKNPRTAKTDKTKWILQKNPSCCWYNTYRRDCPYLENKFLMGKWDSLVWWEQNISAIMKQMRAQRKANLSKRLRGVFRVVRLGPFVNINNKQEAKRISCSDRKLFSDCGLIVVIPFDTVFTASILKEILKYPIISWQLTGSLLLGRLITQFGGVKTQSPCARGERVEVSQRQSRDQSDKWAG